MNYSEALLTGKGITLAEALSTGGKVTVLGLAIVFSVLIVLMLILMLFKVIFYKDPKKQAKKAQSAEEAAPQSAAPQVNEEELIAVLTAAVAASLNTSTYNLQIKSYRRIEDKKPAWNRAGLRETINNRF